MEVNEALKIGIEILKKANNLAPVYEAGVLLCHTLHCDRSRLYSHGDDVLEGLQMETFLEIIQSRAGGMPLQYIIGHQEFMSLDFTVNPFVLIPRQDTEILVETVINEVKSKEIKQYSVLDIGAGSGCICVSLGYYLKNVNITAVDISEQALGVARKNAIKHCVENKIEFICADIHQFTCNKLFDVIVSNPPYIPQGEIESLQVEVREHEPVIALQGGEDGFDFYRIILKKAETLLKTGGTLAFEVGYNQAKVLSEMMGEKYKEIEIVKDLSGIERVVKGVKI